MGSSAPTVVGRVARAGRLVVVAALATTLMVVAPCDPRPAAADVTPGCVVDTSGMLGWWRGEDDLVAEVGPDLTGSVAFDDAVVGRGLALDSTSSVLVDGFPTVSSAVSVETWVKLADSGVVQALLTRWDFPSTDDSVRAYALMVEPLGVISWQTDETSSRRPAELRAVAPQIFDGQFHHVAATWDNSGMALFLDGVEIASQASQGGTLNPTPTTQLRLGSKAGIGVPYFLSGVLDEPSIWARALSAGEVAAIHAAGPAGKCTFVPQQRAKLVAASAAANDFYGFSVDVSGATSVAGAPYATGSLPFTGAAHVYTRTGTTWSQQAMLTTADGGSSDLVGWSVAIDGDTIVAGSYGNNGGGTDSGAAYVFVRSGTTWTQQAKLIASDAAPFDGFGYSVAIDGDTIVVGSPLDQNGGGDTGSAYVFVRSGSTWTEQAKLLAADMATGDNFGISVAIDGQTVVSGAAGHDEVGVDSGAAYVYTRSGTVWSQQAKLVSLDLAATDYFGVSVSVSGNTAVAGAPQDDDAGVNSGSAYVFTRTGSTWTQASKLTAADASAGDDFGFSVAVDTTSVVVGAYLDAGAGPQSGSAYVFRRSGANWSELVKLLPLDAATGDQFGVAVATASGTIIVGSYLDDDAGNNSGSAYVFAP